MTDLEAVLLEIESAVQTRIASHDCGDGIAQRGPDDDLVTDDGECWNDSVDPLFVVPKWVAIDVLWSFRDLQDTDPLVVIGWRFSSDGDDESRPAEASPSGTSIGQTLTAATHPRPRPQ